MVYPESDVDADDEYERSVTLDDQESEASPTDSEGPSSNEHTPTTYGGHSSGDRLPETIISEWSAEECSDFVATIGLKQYGDQFLGMRPAEGQGTTGTDRQQRMRLLARHW
jgi:hypothetical protein